MEWRAQRWRIAFVRAKAWMGEWEGWADWHCNLRRWPGHLAGVYVVGCRVVRLLARRVRRASEAQLVSCPTGCDNPGMKKATVKKKSTKKAPSKKVAAKAPALTAKVGDEAVLKATGRGWPEWVERLDEGGAAEMTHAQIALHLHEKEGVGEWWAQMVTVGYEQAKGRRQKHQKPDGFSVSGSKTIEAPIEAVFRAFTDARQRGRWMGSVDLTVRKATEFKSARITWNAGTGVEGEAGTSVEVNFYEKPGGKSQVAVQHNKIGESEAAEAIKAWWKERLDALKAMLER